jgi:hypothetical protein
MAGGKRTRALAGLGAAALAALALLAPAAQAKQQRVFDGAFAANLAADPYPLANPSSVAVDASPASPSKGDLYVSDPEHHRVEKLDSEGHFILMFGKEVNKTKTEEGKPEAERNVCTLASGDECKAGVAGSSPGAYASTRNLYLAVDSSSGSSAGDLYVADSSASGGDDKVTKLGPAGEVISSWGTSGQMDGSGISPGPAGPLSGPFGGLHGVAVDPSGDLWIYGSADYTSGGNIFGGPGMFELSQGGALLSDWQIESSIGGLFGVAADGEGVYVSRGVIEKHQANGALLGYRVLGTGRFGENSASSIALDPSREELFASVDGFEISPQIRRFEPSCPPSPEGVERCEPAETFESPHMWDYTGLAVSPLAPAKTIYAAGAVFGGEERRLDAYSIKTVPGILATNPSDLTHTSATLNGTVDPAGVELLSGLEGCRFEWGETTAPYEHVAACGKSAAQIGSGEGAVEVSAGITGLQAGHTYHYRLVAANENDGNKLTDEPSRSQDLPFGPPLIENAAPLAVSATGATLGADVNSNGLLTHVRFEYGTEAGVYGHSTEELEVPPSTTGQSVNVNLPGLSPGTVYHYRVVAENVLAEGPEAVLSPDHAFTTQSLAPFSLLDDRGWEMVSPPNKHGALLEPIGLPGVAQAAADGSAIAYLASGPTEGEPAGFSNQVQVLSGRGPSGWSSHDIAPPHGYPPGASIGLGQEYRTFSTDLTSAMLQPFGGFTSQVSPLATEQTPYLRTDFPAGHPSEPCASECYRPVLTAAEGLADVKSGAKFGGFSIINGNTCPPTGGFCGPEFAGATPDLSHVVVDYPFVGLTTASGDEGGLYEWSAATAPAQSLQLVSVLPTGVPAKPGVAKIGSVSETGGGSARNAISTDGSRIAWSFARERLYLRDTNLGQTVRLDTKQPGGSGAGTARPLFQTASSDGLRVFFSDEQALVLGAGAGEKQADLYECHMVVEAGKLKCTLADLTPKAGEESADVLGQVLGSSEDGSYLYFAANGVLAHNKNAAGEEAKPGNCTAEGSPTGSACSLYLLHNGATTFLATLSGQDGPNWAPILPHLSARISPNGRWLAFMSQRPLTGYDNRDVVSGKRDEEVYLYHAGGEGEEGKLVCASCDPSGARPHGVEYGQIESSAGGIAGGEEVWKQSDWIAANIPGWTQYMLGKALYQSRYLSNQGRLFFNAADALIPTDTNGAEDVYEFEPPSGAEAPAGDSCEESSPTYTPTAAGCIDLISSGTSGEESAFLDASESGNDVFFLSSAHLSPRDVDTALDLYDARVGGGEAEGVKPVECIGDACQQPATPPNDATPGSLSYSGPGNVSEEPTTLRCAKGKVKRKGACVAKKHHKHAKKHKRRANHGRRAGR